jgi:hypothetical protein
MSDNNQSTYDFELITQALNLIPYNGLESFAPDKIVKGAFSSSAIVSVRFDESGSRFIIKLYGGDKITMNVEQLIELEATLKRRAKEYQEMKAASIQRQADLEATAQLNAANRVIGEAAVMARLQKSKLHS